MGLPGAFQCRIKSPKVGDTGAVQSWSLPLWLITQGSPSVAGMVFAGGGIPFNTIVIHKRVADQMKIRDGDEVEIEFVEVGDRLKHEVKVQGNLNADVVIHGAMHLGIVTSETYSSKGSEITFSSGATVNSQLQEIWAGIRTVQTKGTIHLYFDGSHRTVPTEAASYGFSLIENNEAKDLVQGYGFYLKGKTSNQMEYEGLLEGLTWASRLDAKEVHCFGDSELVINQIEGTYNVNNEVLQKYCQKIHALLENMRKEGVKIITFTHIPRESNTTPHSLAAMGMATKSHQTICNWQNINKFCKVL